MPTPQRLPIVNSDDGVWGDILRQYLKKEHYDDGTDNAINGGHQKITIQPGTASAGTAPLKFTSGTLLTTPEAGAMEFAGDNYYLTQTSGTTRKKIAAYDDTSGATGDMYYRNSSGYFTRLGAGSTGDMLTISGGLPSWSSSIANTSTITLKDTNFTLQDDGDTTKQLKFQLSGITTGTTRTLTVPDASTTIVGTDATQTLTNKTLTSPKVNNIYDTTNNKPVLSFGANTNAATSFYMYAENAGSSPSLMTIGSDTNINLNLVAKGTGIVTANYIEVATISGTQTLTNKTLTTPIINSINDTNSNTILSLSPTASAVNYLQISNRDISKYPIIQALGADIDIGITVIPKGSGSFRLYGETGQTVMTLSATSSVANTNLDLTTQGTGVVKANGVEVATISGTQTLTNKTLTNPKISSGSAILDSYGNKLLDFNVQVSNAVNYLRIWNRATTIGPIIEAAGTDTNINIQLNPKGSGSIYIWAYSGYTPTITANGADTNHNLNLVPKGTGVVQAGGVEVATISGTQTLTNKTLTTPKMSYITDTNGNTSMLLSASASAVNFLQVVNSATGNPIQIQPNGSDSNVGLSLRARGTGTVTVNTSGGANIAAFSQSTSPVNYFYFTPGGTGVNPQLAAVGTDTDISLNLVSKGTGNVQANGVDVVTISGTQTLTNKTLTAPKIDTIKDTNGATSIQLEAIASAVNFLKVTNSATGTAVSITSTGTDTNVSMSLRPKGTGTIVLRDGANLAVGQFIGVTSAVNRIDVTNAITSVAPSIAAAGSDTNIGLNLVSKGTGTVQANGVEVATISGTQTLTNKTITSAQITGTNEIQQNGTFSLYNTADQTTNYERARAYWSSDTFFLNTEKGGTGTLQALKLASGAAITLTLDGSGGSWKTRFVGSSSQALDLISMGLTSTASSGVPTAQKIDYTVNQSSTAGYTALSVAVTETATGSGTKLLIDTQVGGVSKFSVDNAGNLNTTGSILKDGLPVMTGVVVGSGQLQNNTYSIRRGGRTSWISGLHNDLAYLVERGGAVTCTLNAVDQGDKSNLFRGVTQFLTVGAVNDVYVFEITLPTVDMPYNDAYTLGFQQYGVFAQDITIEIYRGAAWTSVYEVTDTTDDVHWVVPNPSASTTKYRFTFTNFVNTNPFRLMEIFSVCHQAYGLSVKDSMTTLSRNGGNMYGTSSTPPTLTAAGSDTNISLNLVPKGTGVVKAGGVEVTTISGSQTLTNKTLTTPTLNTPTVNGFLLKDANANNLLSYVNSTVATSTSYLTLTTGVSGAGPQVTVTGAEANAGLVFWVKGTGLTQFRSTANSSKSIGLRVLPDANGVNWLDIANAANGSDPEIRAVSYSNEDTDVGINLTTTGTGVVQANGNPIISSITAIPAATGTPDSTTYLRGDGTWSTPSGGGGGMLAPVQGMTLGSETFTISSGSVTQISGTTINGYSPAIGDRILVANAPATTGTGSSYSMTNQPTNGIYEVTGNTTNLTVSRAADMSGSVKPGGLSVYVENADWPASKTLFFVETPNDLSAFTWGTTSISWKWSGGLSGQTQQVWITNNGLGLNIYNGTGWTYIGASNNAGNQDLTLPATTTDTIVARASTDTLTNKTISGASNTLSNIPQSAVTDLVGDLLSKVDLGPVANPLYVDAARVEPLPSIVCQAECTLGTGDMFMMLFRLTENVTVSNILSVATYGVSQTGATACRVGLYEVDEPFAWPYTMTCIARSASSAARWGTAGLDTAPIVDDGAASPGSISSVDLTAGQLYAVAFITVGHSGTAKLKSMGGHRPSSMTPVMAYYGGSHSDMPSSITATGWIEEWAFPWFALT